MRYGAELAEAVGTFALLFAAGGAILVGLDALGIAAVFGLVIAAMIYATGHISGAHFNPAVTLAFATAGHFPWNRVAWYIAAQFTGGLLGMLALSQIFPDVEAVTTNPAPGFESAFLLEILITAMLMFVISAVATDGRAQGTQAGFAIGATVGLNALWAGGLTGASMNPVRSLAPAIATGFETSDLLYLFAPLLGALVGALLYEAVRRGAKPEKA